MFYLHTSYYAAYVLIVFLTQSRNIFYFWALWWFWLFLYIFDEIKLLGTSFKAVSLLLEKDVDKLWTWRFSQTYTFICDK